VISVRRLHLRNFRSYEELDLELSPGLTAIVGDNGNGKTNLIESIGFLSRLSSFRGASTDALVRVGAEEMVVRGEILCGDREVLIEVEIPRHGRMRVLVNKQRLAKRGDLAEVMTTTVFSPDDLEIVKGGPAGRRQYLDDVLVDVHPKNDAACSDFAKVLRQRNALLKQMSGRRSPEAELTLDVWDHRLTEVGERLAVLRTKIAQQLTPFVDEAYALVSGGLNGGRSDVRLQYVSGWAATGLAEALRDCRVDDIRRGVSTVGPHRDDLALGIGGLPVRTHASQGEQRSMVLALRLASHRLVTAARGEAPVLLLDDVFSELDDRRSVALLSSLPEGQKFLTSASALPTGAVADVTVMINESRATVC